MWVDNEDHTFWYVPSRLASIYCTLLVASYFCATQNDFYLSHLKNFSFWALCYPLWNILPCVHELFSNFLPTYHSIPFHPIPSIHPSNYYNYNTIVESCFLSNARICFPYSISPFAALPFVVNWGPWPYGCPRKKKTSHAALEPIIILLLLLLTAKQAQLPPSRQPPSFDWHPPIGTRSTKPSTNHPKMSTKPLSWTRPFFWSRVKFAPFTFTRRCPEIKPLSTTMLPFICPGGACIPLRAGPRGGGPPMREPPATMIPCFPFLPDGPMSPIDPLVKWYVVVLFYWLGRGRLPLNPWMPACMARHYFANSLYLYLFVWFTIFKIIIIAHLGLGQCLARSSWICGTIGLWCRLSIVESRDLLQIWTPI